MKSLIKIISSIIIVSAVSTYSFGQAGVGVGVTSPDPSAVLHIQPPGTPKGLLIPRLTDDQMDLLTPGAAEGLLIYNVEINRFVYFNGGTWYTLNEMTNVAGSSTVTHSGALTINGTVTATNYGLNATGNGPVPQGAIIMWSGSIASIPTGWALCNGANNTPDLRNRFIVAAGQTYQPGNTGGADQVTLTVAQMPSHVHNTRGAWDGGGYDGGNNNFWRGIYNWGFQNSTTINNIEYNYMQATGGSQPHENRPPYYALAFIMKL